MKKNSNLNSIIQRSIIMMVFTFLAILNVFSESVFAGDDFPPEQAMECDISMPGDVCLKAFELGDGHHSILKLYPGEKVFDGNEKKLAFHFVLDNSGSMHNNTKNAQQAFSPLVDVATVPCSLTVFSSSAEVCDSKLANSKVMADIPLPGQGCTNISEGVRQSLEVILQQEEQKSSMSTHHVMVLLSDGQHNEGEKPEECFPKLKKMMHDRAPDIQLSCIVIGVTSDSCTDLGMLFKTMLETVSLDDVCPIYYCASFEAMPKVLRQLQDDLTVARNGRIFKLKSDSADGTFIATMGNRRQKPSTSMHKNPLHRLC